METIADEYKIPWLYQIAQYFPKEKQALMHSLAEKNAYAITEIRIRAHKAIRAILPGKQLELDWTPSMEDIRALVASFCRYSVYARGYDMKNGYLTIRGGHRVGLCGEMQNGEMATVSSLNIRVARQIKGVAAGIIERLISGDRIASAVVISPPGMGKTTLLRDMARMCGNIGVQTAIIDERDELAACERGHAMLDIGQCTDVLTGCGKADGIKLLVRSMAPQVIVTDEIGSREDLEWINHAQSCGVAVFCSSHKDDFDKSAFDYALYLGSSPAAGSIERIVALK